MSRFAHNSDTTHKYTSRTGLRKGTVMQQWRPDVNQQITSSTKIREGARTFVATNRVTGGEAPTCSGHVDVARGKFSITCSRCTLSYQRTDFVYCLHNCSCIYTQNSVVVDLT
jgi:hypothetical protein